VGRERELLEIKRELASTRLLTLVGAGGSGKTRLALEVGRDLAGAYPEGVWLVQLASLSRGDLVAQEAAGALKVREQPGEPIEATLTRYLRNKEALLLLDNCEHLLEACANLSDALLGSCPRLRILATSREPLGVADEVVWRMPPLAVPQSSSTADELAEFASVRLFVERARLKLPAFTLTAQNARAVSEVCRRLDGVPLAVELAAARMGAMAAEHLAERLDNSLGVLSSGPRTTSSRHRTMRATLEWSHGLLEDKERAVFRGLSVFAAGFSLEAAEAMVPGGGNVAKAEVLRLVSSLVEKSLILAEVMTGAGEEPRYRMLEPVRQYAREKLEGSEEEVVIRRRHAAFFLDIAERAAPRLKGSGQLLWLERLSTEHDDLRAAMRWLLDEGEWEMAVRLGWELYLFWWIRGHFTEGRRWMERALEKGGVAMRSSDRARALYVAGTLATGQADYRRAQKLVEESRELFEEVGDEEGVALALGSAGIAAVGQERYEVGIAILEEAVGRHRKLGYEWETAAASALAAGAWLGVGEHGRAEHRAEEALVLARKMGDGTVISAALHVLATIAHASDKRERAKGLFAEGLVLAMEMGDSANVAYYLEGVAEVAASEDELVRAARLWGAAEALLEKIEAAAYTHRADRSLRQSRVSTARARLGEGSWTAAWSEGRTMSSERAVEYALSVEAFAMPGASGNPGLRIRKDVPPADDALAKDPPSKNRLTRRERQIVDLISGGYTTNRQISAELFISERTVETHVRNILKKLGLGSRAQLSAWATERRSFGYVRS
jgi:predicted ATPase/DNA-binding CsgD family transcriptional regulator